MEHLTPRQNKIMMALYLGLYLTCALVLMLTQPLGDVASLCNAPDEHARFLIPQYIYEHGSLPTGLEEEVRIGGYGFSYGIYNAAPLYLMGYVMRFVGIFTSSPLALLYAARSVNVCFGLLMALVVWKIAKKSFWHDGFRWLLCFAVMLFPENVFVHSYVNTDSCCMLSTAIIVYSWTLAAREGRSRKSDLLLALGMILCALSYYNAYGYILCSMFLFAAYFYSRINGVSSYDWKGLFRYGLPIAALVLLGAGWFFARSFVLYDGDFLGLETRRNLSILYADDSVNPLLIQTPKNTGMGFFEMLIRTNAVQLSFRSFVGIFGSMAIPGSLAMYLFYIVFFLAGCIGLVLYLRTFAKLYQPGLFLQLFTLANMILAVLIPVGLMLYYTYAVDYQPQGRYVLPALVSLMLLCVIGIWEILVRFCSARPRRLRMRGFLIAVMLIAIALSLLDMVFVRTLPLCLEAGGALG